MGVKRMIVAWVWLAVMTEKEDECLWADKRGRNQGGRCHRGNPCAVAMPFIKVSLSE